MSSAVTGVAAVVEDYLPVWILGAVAVGLAVPDVAVVTDASTVVLAVMVGSVSLTLPLNRFRTVRPRGLAATLVGHALMPLVAFGIALGLGLSPALTAGFVLLGAVTPELVTPTMTELADGDTALASAVLVLTGFGSTAFVPLVVTGLLGESVRVDAGAIVTQVLLAVVIPMALAVALRTCYDEALGRYEDIYPGVSALMVVLIIGGVAGANAGLVREQAVLLAPVAVGAVCLNLGGYALGWLVTARADRSTRIAGLLSVGMRDFAVAAALVVSAGFPPASAVPALVFGVVELLSSAVVARTVSAGTASEVRTAEP